MEVLHEVKEALGSGGAAFEKGEISDLVEGAERVGVEGAKASHTMGAKRSSVGTGHGVRTPGMSR